jgi:two-component system response regulator YesN
MILEKYVRYVSCYLKGRVVSIIVATEGQSKKYLHILVDEIIQSVNRIMGLKCMVGVSRSTAGIISCRESYLEAMHALSYSHQKENKVHFIADEESLGSVNQEMIQTTTATLEDLLRGGSLEELKEFLEEFSLGITTGKIAPGVADFLIAQMKAGIFKVVYAVAGDSSVHWLDDHFQLNAYHNSMGQVMEGFGKHTELCLAAKKLIIDQRKKSSEVLCDKALEFIETDYANHDLSIVMVSDQIGVSPNYLSALIKKTTGATFVELLTKKRMEEAKDLLLCTSMKIREVADKSGYKDQHYFSYCFKKTIGKSPNQCRQDAQ